MNPRLKELFNSIPDDLPLSSDIARMGRSYDPAGAAFQVAIVSAIISLEERVIALESRDSGS